MWWAEAVKRASDAGHPALGFIDTSWDEAPDPSRGSETWRPQASVRGTSRTASTQSHIRETEGVCVGGGCVVAGLNVYGGVVDKGGVCDTRGKCIRLLWACSQG